jgi:hypothetical protein
MYNHDFATRHATLDINWFLRIFREPMGRINKDMDPTRPRNSV